MKTLDNTTKFIISIAACELAGIIGSLFTTPAIQGWYATLVRPSFAPPNWIFAPVWTTLFALMGIALFLVWRRAGDLKKRKIALAVFFGQLLLNILWSVLFFGLHSPGAAFAEIIVLWSAILTTIILFAKISQPAAWLLVPYLLWVGFAGYLNFSIYDLNKNGPVACTAEVKICDDGSYVARIAPTCEFTACPINHTTIPDQKLWKTTSDENTGISFKYPEQLGTKYISTVVWPPELQILNKAFECNEAGQEVALNGQTKKSLINNRTYCVTKASEGAAGSTYTEYTYALPLNDRTMTLSFTLRAVQCGNYDDPQKTACETERNTFSMDTVADQMIRSISEE